jgi:hypothetical protein
VGTSFRRDQALVCEKGTPDWWWGLASIDGHWFDPPIKANEASCPTESSLTLFALPHRSEKITLFSSPWYFPHSQMARSIDGSSVRRKQ